MKIETELRTINIAFSHSLIGILDKLNNKIFLLFYFDMVI